MKKRNRTTVQDLNRLPVTEVGNKSGFQTRKEFYKEQEQITAREQAAAEEKLMAPVRVAEKQFKQAASEHSAKIRSFFSRPASFIVENCENAPVDAYGDYPLLDGARDLQADNSVRQEFKQNLASSGCTLSESGQTRLDVYLDVLNYYRNISLASVTSWAIGLERLFSLGCFAAGELAGYESVAARRETPKPAAKPSVPTWKTVRELNPENREQKKLIERALGEDFTTEVATFFGLWQDQLRRDYNYVMPDDVIKRALAYVTSANLNPLRHETWNIVRRLFTKNGWMRTADGSLMLTEREKLSELCESSNISDRETRRRINLKNRELLDSEPAYAPHK
jgi:hypothetical protein